MSALTQETRSIIAGCGHYLPETVVSNDELSTRVETSHEWIVERTGIHQRHFAAEGELTSDMALKASTMALENAGVQATDIDLIVLATTSPDQTFPSTATTLQAKLGNTTALAFDVAAVCAGYLVALNVADSFIKLGRAKHALVVGAERLSSLLDMEDRNTCVLFGDGAGATVLRASEASDEDRGIIGVHMQSDGQYNHILRTTGGVASTRTIGQVQMEGREVFRHAVTKLADSADSTLKRYDVDPADLDWLIPHQANLRIIEGMAKKLDMSMDKVITTVQRHANTSAASIPLALSAAVQDGRVKQGDLILHEAIGGGLVWGSALLRF